MNIIIVLGNSLLHLLQRLTHFLHIKSLFFIILQQKLQFFEFHQITLFRVKTTFRTLLKIKINLRQIASQFFIFNFQNYFLLLDLMKTVFSISYIVLSSYIYYAFIFLTVSPTNLYFPPFIL